MRTTLYVEDDVLQAAKELAHHEGTTVGWMMSKFARKGLAGTEAEPTLMRNGVPILPPRGEIITLERVQEIMNTEAV